MYWWAINKITPLASERHTELMALAEAPVCKLILCRSTVRRRDAAR